MTNNMTAEIESRIRISRANQPNAAIARATRRRVTVNTNTITATENSPCTILLVASESMHTELVRMVLMDRGMSVHTPPAASASNPLLQIEIPNLILVDWDAEGVDGEALLRGFRNNADTRKVPVIAMTHIAVTEPFRRKLIPFNVQWILEKPIVTLSLPKLIERTIKSNAAGNGGGANCRYQQCALLVECGETASGALWKAVI